MGELLGNKNIGGLAPIAHEASPPIDAHLGKMFRTATMLGLDFDKTIAQTFEPSPNGHDVESICIRAVEHLFDDDGREAYLKAGGLRNRAPREVIAELTGLNEEKEDDVTAINVITEKFIEAKSFLFTEEIGSRFPDGSIWPRPVPGYLKVKELLEQSNQDGLARHIDEVIISSGHEPFIAKTFSAWGVTQPKHIIATEMTTTRHDFAPAELVKPAAGLMTVARDIWRSGYGLTPDQASNEELRRIIYAGDDLSKDGGLAQNAGVGFVHINESAPEASWNIVAFRLALGNVGLQGTGI